MKSSELNFSNKDSIEYLSQIGHNTYEKVENVVDAVMNNELPANDEGRVKIVECGIGGGESIEELKKRLQLKDDVDLGAVDILPSIVENARNKYENVEFTIGNAGDLPYESNSLSAINLSAVLHEVSSYGCIDQKGKEKYGEDAVKQAMSEFHRVLMTEGMCSYRDLLCPKNRFENTEITYNRKSWREFTHWFLKDFADSDERTFPNDQDIKISSDSNGMKIEASRRIQRELQRHYLMFRDYLRTQASDLVGVEMLQEEWFHKDAGVKSHSFRAIGKAREVIKNMGYEE